MNFETLDNCLLSKKGASFDYPFDDKARVYRVSNNYQVHYHHEGDFLVDEKIILEVGGKSKDAKQIADIDNAYLAIDDIESGYDNVIPLWLFRFLY